MTWYYKDAEITELINGQKTLNAKEIEFRIATSWVVKLEPQDFGHKHYHCNSFFSGVLYLEVDETTSPIVFYRNTSNINEMGNPVIIEIPFDEDFYYNEFNSPSWKYQPKKGDLILFPSTYVYNHSVSPIIEGEKYCVVSWLR